MYSSNPQSNPADYDSHVASGDQHSNANYSRPGAYDSAGDDHLNPTSADPHAAVFGQSNERESYMDSDLEMRKYQGLSASGVAGYSAVGDASEPGSPVHEGSYERSHESGSSGTRVDSTRPRPETMSSEGSFDNRGNGLVSAGSASPFPEYDPFSDFIPFSVYSLNRVTVMVNTELEDTKMDQETTTTVLPTTLVDTEKDLSESLQEELRLSVPITSPTTECPTTLLESLSITTGATRTIKVATRAET